jgi:hypothetical protein
MANTEVPSHAQEPIYEPLNALPKDRAAQQPIPAPIYTPARLRSHRENDDAYSPVVARLEDRVRVIECKDDMQWILQVLRGEQWQGIAYCRTRDALIRASKARGYIYEPLNALPEHYDGIVEITPRCRVCGGIKSKPLLGQPRYLYCLAERKDNRKQYQ